MGAMFPDRGHEQGQEGEGDDGQVIYLSYSRNEIRNQVNGGKGIKSRQSQKDKLASGEQARFSLPAAEVIDGPDQKLLPGAVGRNGNLVFHGAAGVNLPSMERKLFFIWTGSRPGGGITGPFVLPCSGNGTGRDFFEAVFCRRLFIRKALSLLSHALPAASRAIPGFFRE